MADVFLSYKREDRQVAQCIADGLEKQGWSVWWDANISGGRDWDDAIQREIELAKCVLVVWSPQSISSNPVRSEAHFGRENNKLLPVVIGNARPPVMFRLIQAIDLSGWDGSLPNNEFGMVLDAIRAMIQVPKSDAPTSMPSSKQLGRQIDRILEKPMLILNTAWMRDYSGLENDDTPEGHHSWIKEGGIPHEIYNFLPINGSCYGYAPLVNGKLNVGRLGAASGSETAEDILVVWTATDPNGGRFVCGWYDEATVFSAMQHRPSVGSASDDLFWYSVKAPYSSCRLLPIDERYFYVPARIEGFPGMSASFFPDENALPGWGDAIRKYVAACTRNEKALQ